MDTIELPAGSYTFRARAAGPEDGRLVLLLHGFPQSSREWEAQLEALAAAGYRAVAPDQRGYSPSARPEGIEHYAVAHLVSDVLAMQDWLGGHQMDLVGHDWGAAVAWHVAAEHPDRLRTLTAVSVPHPGAFGAAIREDPDQQGRSGYIQFFQQPDVPEEMLLADDAAALRVVYAGLQSTDEYVTAMQEPGALTAALNWYRAMGNGGFAEPAAVSVPTLFVWSSDDPAIGRSAAEACGDRVTGPYRFEVLDGVDHWVPERAADRLNQLLLEHLAAHG